MSGCALLSHLASYLRRWILVFYGFPFPITLTMWHMAFSSVLAFACVQSGWIPMEKNIGWANYVHAVLPVAFLFAGVHSLVMYALHYRGKFSRALLAA